MKKRHYDPEMFRETRTLTLKTRGLGNVLYFPKSYSFPFLLFFTHFLPSVFKWFCIMFDFLLLCFCLLLMCLIVILNVGYRAGYFSYFFVFLTFSPCIFSNFIQTLLFIFSLGLFSILMVIFLCFSTTWIHALVK